MEKYLSGFVMLILLNSIAFANEDNGNAWHPNAEIPNIYLVELYTFHGMPRNTEPELEIKILVNHGYVVGYSEELKVPIYAVYRYGRAMCWSLGLAIERFLGLRFPIQRILGLRPCCSIEAG